LVSKSVLGSGDAQAPADPGGREPLSFTESPLCDNWWDNDGDTFTDFGSDPECGAASDMSEAQPGSQCGLGFELTCPL
jgi:hypothetical protein